MMMWIYRLITAFIIVTLFYVTFKKAKKWHWVMSAMILIPLILRFFLIK